MRVSIEPSQGRECRESRAAVLRRSEQTRFSSASDDEVGGFHARCANAPKKGGRQGQRSGNDRRGGSMTHYPFHIH